MQVPTKLWTTILGGIAIGGILPNCNCENSGELQRASVELALTFVEPETCSGARVPRRIPDDYTTTGRPMSTDFGSRAERTFEIRSKGTAPLSIFSVALSAEDSEFTMQVVGVDGQPASFPTQLVPSNDSDGRPGMTITVAYASQDNEPDLVDLVVTSDDPNRTEIRFGLSAGRGTVQVCAANGCDAPAVSFGNVPIATEGTEVVTIKNVGDGDLDLRSLKLQSASAEFCSYEVTELPEGTPDCTLVPECLVLKPQETYEITLRYRPGDGGEDTGVLSIVTGDAAHPTVDVPINAMGAGPAVCPCVVDGANCTPVQVVDFGAAGVGATASRTIRLVSCGTDQADLTEITLETDPNNLYFTGPEYQITQAFMTGVLPVNAYSEGTVSYTPSSPGTFGGGLRFTMGPSGLKSWIRLNGSAAACDLEAFPGFVNFGTVAGGAFAERRVALVNNGSRECLVSAITDPANGYSITNRPQLPATVGPGDSVELVVRFDAPNGGEMPFDSSFDVTSDEPAPGSNITVQLSAIGGGVPTCEITVQPGGGGGNNRDGVLQFGAVNIGFTKMLPIRIDNVGNTDCRIDSLALNSIAASTQFVVQPAMAVPHSIGPGQSSSIDVTFAPTMPSPTGRYTPFFNSVDFVMSGAGLAKPNWSIGLSAQPTNPSIDVVPRDIDFGVVTWENPQAPDNRSTCGSQTRTVNVYNTGTGDLHITSLAIDPSSDPVFLISQVLLNGSPISGPYTNVTMPGGSTMEVQLRFFPSRDMPAAHSGLLVIDNDVTNPMNQGAPLTVPLIGEGTSNSSQTDRFQQLVDNKIDILWVVDDSCSMQEEQAALANNFDDFIAFADTLGVDYQVGVLTTEVNNGPAGKLWSCNGYNKIIRSSDPNRVQAFMCAANVTSPPSGNQRPNPMGSDAQEAGLQAARKAVDVPLVNNENAGFLREDARLAVIVVSDEEDQSVGTVNLYVDFFRTLKGYNNRQLVSVSGIVGDVPNGCATAAAGQRYYDAVSQLNGQFESICSPSWSTMLQNIGLGVFALREAWTLTRPADPASIVVRVNGTNVPQNGTNGWTYDAGSNTLSFHGTAVPGPGANIEVQYGAVCLP